MNGQGQCQIMSLTIRLRVAFRIALVDDMKVSSLSRTVETTQHQSTSSGSLSRGWMATTSLDRPHQTAALSLHMHFSRQQDYTDQASRPLHSSRPVPRPGDLGAAERLEVRRQ